MTALVNGFAWRLLSCSRNHALRYSLLRRQQSFSSRSFRRPFTSSNTLYRDKPKPVDPEQPAQNDNKNVTATVTSNSTTVEQDNAPPSGSEPQKTDEQLPDRWASLENKRSALERELSELEKSAAENQGQIDSTKGLLRATGGFLTSRRTLESALQRAAVRVSSAANDTTRTFGDDRLDDGINHMSSDPQDLPLSVPAWLLKENVVRWQDIKSRQSQDLKISGGDDPAETLDQGLIQVIKRFQKVCDSDEFYDQVGPFSLVPNDIDNATAFLSLSHFLEIAVSMSAGLGLPKYHDDTPASYASIRKNLALYSPSEGSKYFMREVVEAVAQSEKADILHLNAHDIAELYGYIFPDENRLTHDSGLSSSFMGQNLFSQSSKEDPFSEEEGHTDDTDSPMSIARFLPKFQADAKPRYVIPGSPNAKSHGGPTILGIPAMGARLFAQADELSDDQTTLEQNLRSLVNQIVPRRERIVEQNTGSEADIEPKKLVICVSDFMEVSSTSSGRKFLEVLGRIVTKDDKLPNGRALMIVGLSASNDISVEGLGNVQADLNTLSEETSYRALVIPPLQEAKRDRETTEKSNEDDEDNDVEDESHEDAEFADAAWEKARSYEILQQNLRHLKDMMNHINGTTTIGRSEMTLEIQDDIVKDHLLDSSLLNQSEVHRLATLVAGLDHILSRESNNTADLSENEKPKSNLELALSIVEANELDTFTDEDADEEEHIIPPNLTYLAPTQLPKTSLDLKGIKAKCDSYEKKLLRCIISPQNIRTTFSQIHAPEETIEALRTLTSLSLLRPDAFTYGVLRSESLPGLLLYGPPGTGKTLLAKAVAKESGATMLSVSGSEVNNMYVGESEKTVRAIFSLARKLAPCVIFIDEADGMLNARSSASGPRRTGHRDTLNQFLKEIEHFGGSEQSAGAESVFLMVATNRPFDLDDAVLRRLPRRLLVDLPTEADREKILAIHLRHEALEDAISLPELAKRTAFYSGSDLKNLCVAAALACVREENAAAKVAQEQGNVDYRHPEKRTLTASHFETAIGEISASVSEDMGTLKQIRQFDEKYGDRKGRRKKSVLGFGQREVTDDQLRVRT
ncbi:AAA-domain-containing protein [Microthyrium microscopicum]|uniref:AAA-domain-containing protein n=1 Tax=Microthyrium microscopicum TaxID=703497 RepID=A0A6A6U9I6_9PEZI|nr:AAA-domain-containing protein [Microthyrium microscopicum]